MKRLFVNFMTFAVMATALTLTACSSDSDGDGDGNGDGGTTVGPVALLLWAKISCPAR